VIERPLLAPTLSAWSAGSEGVVLLSATRDLLLEGRMYEPVIRALHRRRSVDDLTEAISDRVPLAEGWFALRTLDGEGCLVAGDADVDDGRTVPLRDVELVVGIALAGTRDLLDPALSSADARATEARRGWVPVCRTDGGIWLGPYLSFPGDGDCWHCLEEAILCGRPAASLVRQRALERIGPFPAPVRLTPGEAEAIARLVREGEPGGAVLSLDAAGKVIGRHPVRPRPSCKWCGAPPPPRGRRATALALDAALPLATEAALERAAEDFLLRHAALLDPVTGIARGVGKAALSGCDAVHVYVGGPNRARWSGDLAAMRRDLRQYAGGKGWSDALARASLLGELAERTSAVHRGDEARIVATFAELGGEAVHPNACMLFSDAQLARPDDPLRPHDRIPRRLPDVAPIGWTPLWSMTRGATRYLPTGYLYFDYAHRQAEPYCFTDSNGNAAGATREQAILQGMLEVVERDSAGIWWYNRGSAPGVTLASLEDERSEALVAQLLSMGRVPWVLDITTDLGIPTCVAVSRSRHASGERPLLGFGAHLTRRDAAVRALSELGQMTAAFGQLGVDASAYAQPLRDWMERATTATRPYLLAAGETSAPPGESTPPTVAAAIDWCRQRLEAHQLECLVLDQTRDDIGVPAVKVVVPGLRHFHRRLGAGRLYDVPVRAGWRAEPTTEGGMNPTDFPF